MLTIKRILFPTDYSVCAEHAFSHAAYLAEHYQAELHILHVVEGVGAYLVEPDDEDQSERTVHPMADYDVPVVQIEQYEVTAEAAILKYAAEAEIDLVVMGTHGRRGLDRLVVGSTAEQVMRLAPCPVLTVRPNCPAAPGRGLQRVVVAVDFSPQSRQLVACAKELAAAYQAHLDVLHVIMEAVLPTVYGVEPVAMAVSDITERVRKALMQLSLEAEGPEVQTSVHVRMGHPADQILEFVEDRGSDLIVASTHGRSGLRRFFLGSVAEQVTRMASCPVFVLRSFGKSLLGEVEAVEQASP